MKYNDNVYLSLYNKRIIINIFLIHESVYRVTRDDV